jgi:hypothetical protein
MRMAPAYPPPAAADEWIDPAQAGNFTGIASNRRELSFCWTETRQ